MLASTFGLLFTLQLVMCVAFAYLFWIFQNDATTQILLELSMGFVTCVFVHVIMKHILHFIFQNFASIDNDDDIPSFV